MAQSQSFIGQPSTSQFSPFVELHQSIPSQVEAISPFLDQLMRFIRRFRSEDGSEVDIEIALREALTNAIVHGNHENPEKRVYVASRCSQDGEVLVTIRDLGQGFDSRLVPDPTAPENRLSAHGRGIYLMQALMDEVQFEEGGTVVKLHKQSNSTRATQSKRIEELKE
ncbi:MAG TPA: ATP-binding protein [Terriglobales bacterium]|jgi:serine/threonine-protein kinase RsbW|nr:ATP-binding protein [Terriglobales bacterium]